MSLDSPGESTLRYLESHRKGEGHLPVILLVGQITVATVLRAVRAGATVYLETPPDPVAAQEIITRSMAADAVAHADRARRTEIRARLSKLTPREHEVLALVVQGHANKTIAAALNRSQKTVEVHRTNIMRKTQAGSLASLVRMVLDAGTAAAPTNPVQSITVPFSRIGVREPVAPLSATRSALPSSALLSGLG
jgi:two-component system response regulator FixJ